MKHLPKISLILSILFILSCSEFKEQSAEKETKHIVSDNGKNEFNLESKIYFISEETNDTLSILYTEVAETHEEHEEGLMNRTYMSDTVGMLFIYKDAEEKSFWMKDTFIPLDIMFINNDMKIIKLHEYTIPDSQDDIPSEGIAKYVIEVNAGYSQKNGIKEGDLIDLIPQKK